MAPFQSRTAELGDIHEGACIRYDGCGGEVTDVRDAGVVVHGDDGVWYTIEWHPLALEFGCLSMEASNPVILTRPAPGRS